MKKGTKDAIRLLAVASTMGMSLVLATVLGLAAGYYLDRYFGTKPWLTIVFLVLGIIAGFKNIYVITRRVQSMEKEKDEE